MKMQRRKKNQPRKIPSTQQADVSRPFIEHLYEVRKRLVYIVASILLFSTLAYFVQQYLVDFLLRPAKGQQFIYTSPGGGISFLFSICTYVGIAASIPVIIYQILGFLDPLIADHTRRRLIKYSFASSLLAVAGFCFGYFLGLPIALHFLTTQFTNRQIHPLFTIQEYMSFLMIYLLGSALLCQLPLFLTFANHIKPLPPRKLLKAERYVIVAAFIIAMIMAPTTNVFDQLIIAGPIIVVYNFSILLLWATNRKKRVPSHLAKLLEADREVQAARFGRPVSLVEQKGLAYEGRLARDLSMMAFGPGRKRAMDITPLYPTT